MKMAEFTPMMQQYLATKEKYKDCILFYRLGDFYEMFFDDAKIVSKELELTLTGKNCGMEERAPMCGVPYHAADLYLNRLIAKGYKVAICEQLEDPATAKGLVKRDVIRVVTPGTNVSQEGLDESRNNYLMCILYLSGSFGIAITDVSTGDFSVTEVSSRKDLYDEIFRFTPSEILCNDTFEMSGADLTRFHNDLGTVITVLEDWYLDESVAGRRILDHFHTASFAALGLDDFPSGTAAAGALLLYLYETQKNSLGNITRIMPYKSGGYMIIDNATRRNLELVETLREKQKRGSLLWVLDKTRTAMGARLLRSWIEQPLIEKKRIVARQDAIDELGKDMITREEIREYLNAIYDLERLTTRITYQSANPRDLIAFKTSVSMLAPIRNLLDGAKSNLLKEIRDDIDPLDDLQELIETTIIDDPPLQIREGGIIRTGCNEDVDHFREAQTNGKAWLAKLEAQEREATGIKNLRIRYNKVFGYYLEVTNSFKDLVPQDWIRKQTLTGAERYITPELKELEDTILGAQDRLSALEFAIFCETRDKIAQEVVRIQKTAKAVARLDVLSCLSFVAQRNHYCRPAINTRGVINIKNGRHPVVELMNGSGVFVENDTYLDNKEHKISIITGPNMAGKSTYMRQSALIVLMAQIGSFVPASEADIGLVDRIFTRVGASDDLASGQSTFMVEMTEVANILRNATSKSLLILDEIGRGTSTFDGLSIAWSVVEHISNPKLLGAKTLFATHYHELTELEGKIKGVNNYCIAVKEQGDDIIFLRKIIPGGADKSYGIQVARLAGVPDSVIQRAKEISNWLINKDITENIRSLDVRSGQIHDSAVKAQQPTQMTLFDLFPPEDEIISKVRDLDLSNMTPIQALTKLDEIQKLIKERDTKGHLS